MSGHRCVSDDLPALLLLSRVLEGVCSYRWPIPGVPAGTALLLLDRVRGDAARCTSEEFDAIVYWLTGGRPGPPEDGATT